MSPYPAQTDAEGVIMAFPSGKPGPSGGAWNVGPCCVAGVDDVANLFISCQLATDQIQQGKASPSLSAIVEVGRVYNLELAMDFSARKRFTIKPTLLAVSNRLEDGDPEGPLGNENVLKWSEFVITVGSSTDDLRAQIEDHRTGDATTVE